MIETAHQNDTAIPRFPFLILTMVSLLTVIFVATFIIANYISDQKIKSTISDSMRAMELQRNILKYDETLTMSARMYAVTRDPQWERRYLHYKPMLSKLLKDEKMLFSDLSLSQKVGQTDIANDKLVSLETQAFRFGHQGKFKEASAILFSKYYLTEKTSYSEGMVSFTNYLNSQMKINIEEAFSLHLYLLISIVIFVVFIIGSWVFIFNSIIKWKRLLEDLLKKELQYKLEIETSRDLLEARVKLRTEELETANKALHANEENLKVINKELRESEHRFHSVVEHSPVSMGIQSLDGKFLESNQALENLLGYTKEELLQKTIKDITYHDKNWDKELGLLEQLIQNKIENYQIDKQCIQKDGSLIWVDVNTSRLTGHESEPSQLIGQVFDISKRKNFEIDITALNMKMQETVKQLEQTNYENNLLNDLYELLLSCKNLKEAYSVIDMMANRLFLESDRDADISGGLAIYNMATHNLELVGQGGTRLLLEETFSLDDCWALREGREYLVDDPKKNVICNHFKKPPPGGYICIPLIVRNEVIGLFSQNVSAGIALTTSQRQLANSFAAVVKVSLANLKLNAALNESSIRDSLTGLYNRRYLDEALARELMRAKRLNHDVFVAMLDLDHFKQFNTIAGHEAGDEVLKFIGKLLLTNFRGNDLACRFGGEEFVIILVDTDFDSAVQRMKTVCAEVKKAKVVYHNQVLPPVTISIGVAQAPLHGETVDAIIRAADEAMYDAKQAGRNRVAIFQ